MTGKPCDLARIVPRHTRLHEPKGEKRGIFNFQPNNLTKEFYQNKTTVNPPVLRATEESTGSESNRLACKNERKRGRNINFKRQVLDPSNNWLNHLKKKQECPFLSSSGDGSEERPREKRRKLMTATNETEDVKNQLFSNLGMHERSQSMVN
jgi:hypothetical protein